MTMRLILALLFASTLAAQTIWQLPLWNGQRYEWPTLGPSFVIQGGVVDVLPAPPAKIHKHTVGAVLAATGGAYTIPAAAVNLALYRNGIRQTAGVDYDLKAGVITTLYAWGAGNLVVADYEIP
jgi:hypothetical protein